MPALPSPGKVIRLDYHFTVGSDVAAKCRTFYSYTGVPPGSGVLNPFASTVLTDAATRFAPLMTSDRILTSLVATDLSSSTGDVGVATTATAGTRSGGSLPADICTLQSLEIARRFRGGHPRIYWPFGADLDLLDPQHWNVAWPGIVKGQLDGLDGDTEAAVWAGGGVLDNVSVSFYSGFTVHTGVTGRARNVSTPRFVPLVDPIVSTIVRQGVATQRKRLLRLA
jgi:hypothetical protein